jgi:hypothetical protein
VKLLIALESGLQVLGVDRGDVVFDAGLQGSSQKTENKAR